MLRPLALAAALAGSAAARGEDFGFEPPIVLSFVDGTRPNQLLATDVTGDGLPDLVVASDTQGLIVVRNHEGSFMFGAGIPTTLPAPVDRWRAGDMNGDGLSDVVVRPKNVGVLGVLLSDGENGFTLAGLLDISLLSTYHDHELLDADEDGDLDVMLQVGNALRLCLGDGDGSVGPPGTPLLGPPGGSGGLFLHTLDLDGDAHADLAAVGSTGLGGHGWAAWTGDGDGHFTLAPGSNVGVVEAVTFDSCLGDLGGDGWTDLFVSFLDHQTFLDPGALQQIHGTGAGLAGAFPQTADVMPNTFGSMRMADLDGDGLGDLVGAPAQGWFGALDTLWILRGAGGHEFAEPIPLKLSAKTFAVALADLDGNGVTDVLVSHGPADTVSVLRSTTLPPGWSDLGGALPGAGGVPQLDGSGALLGGQAVQLRLAGAAAAAPVALVIGFTLLGAPFKGGTLVPDADAVIAGLVTDAAGQLALQGRWPAGVPAGVAVWMQAWIADASGPKGFASSNGLGAKTAP